MLTNRHASGLVLVLIAVCSASVAIPATAETKTGTTPLTEGDQFEYPYAINEDLYLASFSAYEGFKPFNGRTWEHRSGCTSSTGPASASCWPPTRRTPVSRRCRWPLGLRPRPRPSAVDYRRKDGICFLQDGDQSEIAVDDDREQADVGRLAAVAVRPNS